MGDVKMRRENIRYEARGKSFEIECPSGFSGIEAIVCWCDAGGGWHREAFESFLDARGRLDGLMRGDEATMCFVERTVVMNSIDAIDPDIQPVEVGLAAGEWMRFHLKGIDPVMVKQVRYDFKDVDGSCVETDRN